MTKFRITRNHSFPDAESFKAWIFEVNTGNGWKTMRAEYKAIKEDMLHKALQYNITTHKTFRPGQIRPC